MANRKEGNDIDFLNDAKGMRYNGGTWEIPYSLPRDHRRPCTRDGRTADERPGDRESRGQGVKASRGQGVNGSTAEKFKRNDSTINHFNVRHWNHSCWRSHLPVPGYRLQKGACLPAAGTLSPPPTTSPQLFLGHRKHIIV